MATASRRSAESQTKFAVTAPSSLDAAELLDFVENAAMPLHWVGADGTILWANPAELRLLGYEPQEYIGHKITEFHVDAPVIHDVLCRLTSGEEIRDYEARVRAKDGSIKYVAITSNGYFRNGEFIHTRCFTRDITEQKLAVQSRKALERELLLLIEASSALLASPHSQDVLRQILDTAAQFITADAYAVWRKHEHGVWRVIVARGLSDQYERTTAEQQATVNSPLPPEPVAIEDVQAFPLTSHRAAYYRAEGIRSMLTVPLKIGGEIGGTIVFYHRTPHTFSESEIRIGGALGNLAAAALGTAELYEAQSESRSQAEHARARATFLAEAGAVLSSSLEYETTLKRVAETAVATLADWCAVDVVNDRGELRRVALAHQDPAMVEFAQEFRRKYPPLDTDPAHMVLRSGKPILLEEATDEMVVRAARSPEHLSDIRALGINSFIVVPLMARGQTTGTLTLVTTDSARKYTQADLEFAEELARRAGMAIDNARLHAEIRESEQALRKKNRELEEFSYVASHDLQEPLRTVNIYTQLLVNRFLADDEEAKTFASYIRTSVGRMEMLIADLLSYSRVVHSDESIQGSVDLAASLTEARRVLDGRISEAGARVSAGPLPRIRGDATQLALVFQNLLSNSLKYRRTDVQCVIDISAERERDQWIISVRDNGIGFRQEYAERIFGLFKRLHKTDYPGTGLGLAICQRIVERHGGRIWAEGTPGCGAVFYFTLPAAVAEPSLP